MEDRVKLLDLSDLSPVKAQYYGIDLHKDQITWHCITRFEDGTNRRSQGSLPTPRIEEEFIPLLDKMDCFAIIEASCSTFFLYGLLEAHCVKVCVVNPLAFREMFMTGKKTDRIDAKRLADRLMYHIELNDPEDGFPEVFVPDAQTLQIRKLVTTYELLVKQSTQIKNQAKSVYRSKMIDVAVKVFDEGFEKSLADARLDSADFRILRSLKALYDGFQTEKEHVKGMILALGTFRFRREVELLTTISGVSLMGATVFMSDIVTVDRFANAKKLASYLASVGKVDSSGNTTRNGGLNKRGRRTSYRFILQGLEHLVKGNEHFKDFKERHGSTRYNKVRSAIVRKTFVTMYYMLKNDEPYRFLNQAIYTRKMKELRKIAAYAA